MGFWIFMLVTDLLIPLTMIGFGRFFMKNAPKEINAVFGYRTSMSMKNADTWEFAHKYFGRLWYIAGLVLLPVTILPMLFVIGESTDSIGNVGGVICVIQMLPFICSIFLTEAALRKRFDRKGEWK